MASKENKSLSYKGRPIVRMGGIIYYGDPGEKYVIMMQVLSSEDFKDMKLSRKISVQLHLTDPEVNAVDRIIKRTEKTGMYEAFDIADIWLERALTEN